MRNTNLTSHHHHIFVGNVESGRPQTVPIEDSSNISGTKKKKYNFVSEEQALFSPEQLNFFLPSIRECDQRWSVPRLHRAAGPSAAEGMFLLYFHIKTLLFPGATCRSPSSPPALQGRFARLPELPSSLPRAMTCFNSEVFSSVEKKKRQPAACLHQELDRAIDASRVREILLDNWVERREVAQQGARHYLKSSRMSLTI